MNVVLLLAGILVLVLMIVDSLWTTLWVEGHAGPLSRRVMQGVQRAFRILFGPDKHRRLSIGGPVALVVTVVTWMMLLWLGWTLVFLAEPGAFARASPPRVPDAWSIAYYAGFTIFTLGTGDVYPVTPVAQMLTVLAVGSGLFLVTLSVTYVITVLSSVVEKRALAAEILGVGDTPAELVAAGWDGENLSAVAQHLAHVSGGVSKLAQQHLAYPILHAYHDGNPTRAASVAVVVLDEALTIMEHGVLEDERPSAFMLKRARAGVDDYLSSLQSASIHPAREPPPPPSLKALRDARVPVVDDATFARAIEPLAKRRRLLAGLLDSNAWRWNVLTKE